MKYVGDKARFINHEYKLFYMGKMTNRYGMGIAVQQALHDVVGVSGISDRLMAIRLIFADEIIHIVSAYALKLVYQKPTKFYFGKFRAFNPTNPYGG